MSKLGVNIDHVATLRQARGEGYPDPVLAAAICEKAGADSIVCHLREDRRHINDVDVKKLRKTVKTRLNLEMSLAGEIVEIACRIKPDQATLVPEKRQELTTEGGLDVVRLFARTQRAVAALQKKGIEVSLFIDPIKKQIKASKDAGADMISLINTVNAMVIDLKTRRPVLHHNKGGLSGPAIKPIAVYLVNQVHNYVKDNKLDVPIIGMGGVMTYEDVLEFIIAGASAVSIGTGSFYDPFIFKKVTNKLSEYLGKHKINDIKQLIGSVTLNQ